MEIPDEFIPYFESNINLKAKSFGIFDRQLVYG